MTITKFHEHLPQILESLGVGVVIIDRSNRHIVYANQKMSEIINVPKEEIIGKVCSTYICPDEVCPYATQDKPEDSKVCVCLNSSGNLVPITKTVTSLELGDGQFLLESIIDISENVKNQKKLSQLYEGTLDLSNQENLSDSFDALLNDIRNIFGYMFLGIGQQVGSTIQYRHTNGWAVPNEILKIPIDSSISGKCLKTGDVIYVPDTLLDSEYASVEGGQKARSELVLPIKIDGKIEYILNLEHSEPNEFSESDIDLIKTLSVYASEVLTGIQHKETLKETTVKLQNSFEALSKVTAEANKNRRMFESVTEYANDGIILLDSMGMTKVWNQAAVNMFGVTESEIIGKRFYEVIIPNNRKDAMAKGWTLWETGEGAAKNMTLELVGKRSDGSEIPIELSISRMDLDNEQNYIGILRDISDRKDKETKIQNLVDELQRSNEDLENYNYIVSHDLKAPIRSMETFSQFVLDDNKETLDEDSVLHLNRIINAAKRMNTLINNLLQLSRVGKMHTQMETVNLNEVIQEILQDISGYLKQKNGTVTYSDLPTLSTQKVWISQVFTNLITNGIKYNQSTEPIVQISCSIKDDQYLFEFKDNGIGIDPEYTNKVFELFQRLHPVDEYEGTGAGLPIVKKILAELGGKIWFESTSGEGTTFFFTLSNNK